MIFVILLACLVFLTLNAVIAFITFHIIVTPDKRTILKPHKSKELVANFDYETIQIKSLDKVRLNSYFIKNPDSNNLVIILHGYGSHVGDLATYINHFHSKGYSILLPELRGHGGSEGICGLGYRDAQDILLWTDKIQNQTGMKYRTVLFGISMGATTALNAVIKSNNKFNVLIADSLAPDFFSTMKKIYQWRVKYPWRLIQPFLVIYIKIIGRVNFKDLSLFNRIQSLNIPVLFIHGEKDALIDTYSVLKLYDLIRCKKDILIIDTDHTEAVDDYPEKYWEKIDTFIMDNI